MRGSTGARLLGFTAAVGTTVALAGFAASSTGAYFTDAKSGQINVKTGAVKVSTSDLSLSFAGLLPGDYPTKDVTFTNTGTAPEDIWLVFPQGAADAFNHAPQPGPVPLGRYGHFAVSASAGTFSSFNLAAPAPGSSDVCSVSGDGLGGYQNLAAANKDDYSLSYCPVPQAILLQKGLPPNTSGTAHLTFGFTPLLADDGNLVDDKGQPYTFENQTSAPLVNFKIVATQKDIKPTNANNAESVLQP